MIHLPKTNIKRNLVLVAVSSTLYASGYAGASEATFYVTKTIIGTAAKYEVSFDGGPVAVMNAPIGAIDGTCPVHAKVRTDWPAGTKITLRRKFFLPDGARNVKVLVGVNDTAYVYVNGQIDDLGVIVDGHCPEVANRHGVEADAYVKPGLNRIEVEAFGDANRFITLSITAEVPADTIATTEDFAY